MNHSIFPYNPYTAPLRIEARFSWWAFSFYTSLHLSSALVVSLSTLPWLWIGLALVGISLHAVHVLRYHLLYLNHPLQGCVLHEHEVKLRTSQAGQYGELAANSYSSAWVIVLRVKLIQPQPSGQSTYKTLTMILFPDALAAQTLRHLRIRLRHQAVRV